MARFKLNWDWVIAIFLWFLGLIAFGMIYAERASATQPCGHFFKQQVVYAQPVYAAQVYYQAGRDIEADAITAKVIKAAVPQIVAELRQQFKSGSVQQQTTPNAFAKCISCHSGNNARGGVVLDGATAIVCHTYWRWGEMAGIGKDVPPAMKKLLDSMTPEEKGAINTAMLNLGEADRTRTPEIPQPSPGVLQ